MHDGLVEVGPVGTGMSVQVFSPTASSGHRSGAGADDTRRALAPTYFRANASIRPPLRAGGRRVSDFTRGLVQSVEVRVTCVAMTNQPRSDVAALLLDAADLSARAAALADDGAVEEALALEDQADRLRRRARSRARINARAEALAAQQNGTAAPIGTRGPANSAREVTISALNELGVPSAPRAVADYAAARFAADIDYRALAALRRDELRSWASPRTRRPVYVVPALEGHRFLPVRGKIALSIWPLADRLIGPWSERADHLRATVNVARQAGWLMDAHPEQAEPLLSLLARYAQTIAGAAGMEPPRVEAAAAAELAVMGEPDTEWRAEAAQRAQAVLDERGLVWGATPPRVLAGRAG
jgi:hypothetical protein